MRPTTAIVLTAVAAVAAASLLAGSASALSAWAQYVEPHRQPVLSAPPPGHYVPVAYDSCPSFWTATSPPSTFVERYQFRMLEKRHHETGAAGASSSAWGTASEIGGHVVDGLGGWAEQRAHRATYQPVRSFPSWSLPLRAVR